MYDDWQRDSPATPTLPLWETPRPRSASLDPQEIAVDTPGPSAHDGPPPADFYPVETFRHSGWAPVRDRIYAAMHDLALEHAPPDTVPPLRNRRLEAFRTCGTTFWILRHRTEPTRFKVAPANCHDRLCTPCNTHRTMLLKTNAAASLRRERHRFVTLTLRHSESPLSDQLDHLYASFRRLRQRALWKRNVTGGLAMLELQYNVHTHTWHAHLHILCTGHYFPQDELSRAWQAASRGSIVVHIKDAPNRKRVIGYILKYANKPIPPTVTHEPAALREAILAVRNRRLVIPFGTWSKLNLLRDPDEQFWTLYATQINVQQDALNGDPLAAAVAAMICTADPFTGEFFVELDHFPPDT